VDHQKRGLPKLAVRAPSNNERTALVSRPLEDMRIIDLTHMLAGPFATYQLHLHGAEVIKIESPGSGEPMRWTKIDGMRQIAPSFQAINAGKKSLALDLKNPRGRDLLLQLIKGADALVENFRPGVMRGLGLDYATVAALNPGLVYCSVSGFGQTGPLRDRPAYDHVVQAITGMAMLNGDADQDPVKVGFPVVDIATGMNAASAILAALLRKVRFGKGQYIDLSMVDSAVTLMSTTVNGFLSTGREAQRIGNRGFTGSPGCDTFDTARGFLAIGANTGLQFVSMCSVLGVGAVLSDASLLDLSTLQGQGQGFVRAIDGPRLRARLCAALMAKTAGEWEVLLIAAEVPAARLRGAGEFTEEVTLLTPGSVITSEAASSDGKVTRTLNVGHRTLYDPPGTDRGAPNLGADTLDILQAQGLSLSEINDLHEAKVIGITPPQEVST
jgi:crotonobetainyl-CoA:carnitine CoA-transferase CaiB-like acyl-CoA transferase